jgi:hypothetical protein
MGLADGRVFMVSQPLVGQIVHLDKFPCEPLHTLFEFLHALFKGLHVASEGHGNIVDFIRLGEKTTRSSASWMKRRIVS